MGKLIYGTNCSLDGYIEDASGDFQFAAPDEEVHQFFNDTFRDLSAHIYGRRLYETMVVWEDWDVSDEPPAVQDFAQIWRGVDKIVYSRTLEAVSSDRTKLEREFDPAAIRELVAGSAGDIIIGGAELAAAAFDEGLVDSVQLAIAPVAIGGGTPALPIGQRLDLSLTATRSFDSGWVHLTYDVAR